MIRLQQLVLNAQRIYEDSWSESLQRYNLTMMEAAQSACKGEDKDYWYTVYLLNQYAWNDAQNLIQPI